MLRAAKPSDAADIAAVHVASWNAHYRGILSDEMIAARSYERRLAQWSSIIGEERRITFVATDNDRLVGFISAVLLDRSHETYDAYLQTLYLLPDATRGGLGKELLGLLARRLRELGKSTLVLRVLRLNPARAFYEKLGARLSSNGVHEDEGLFDDVVYVFDDIGPLV